MAEQVELKHLFTPLKIGTFTIRNRIHSTPHGSLMMEADGLPGDRVNYYWASKAQGGIGLIGTQVHTIHESAGGNAFAIESFVPRYRKSAEVIHEYGAKGVIQVWHPGTQSSGAGIRAIWSPSTVPSPNQWEVPHEMENEEVWEVIRAYGYGAARVRETGMDGVEIHGAHGYLHTQFLSPLTNKRDDEFGGDFDRRLRFTLEVINEVRRQVGSDYTVGLRISGDEFVEGGYNLDDFKKMVVALAGTGKIDYMSVSAGNYRSMWTIIAPMYFPIGSFVYLAAAAKELVNIPVFCVGRINDPVQADQIVANNQADVVGMTRANIADPELPNKAREGRLQEIRKCIGCNEGCWGRATMYRLPITCAINPVVSRENEWQEIKPAAVKKKVMVIGGGAAGCEAARVAKLRGHDVSLYEKSSELGGQVHIAAKAPGRQDFAEVARWYTHQMQLLGVDVHLNSEVTPELVKQVNPDAVVVATGATAGIPSDIPGTNQTNVVTAWDVLLEKASVGQNVLVVALDHHIQGLNAADFLLGKGKKVELINEELRAGVQVETNTIHMALQRLYSQGIKLTPCTVLKRIEGSTAVVANALTGQESLIEGIDTFVISDGGQANPGIYRALKGQVKELHLIGAALAPRRILESTYEGGLVGRAL